ALDDARHLDVRLAGPGPFAERLAQPVDALVAVLLPLLACLDLVPGLAVLGVELPGAPIDVAVDHAPRLGTAFLAEDLRGDLAEVALVLGEGRHGECQDARDRREENGKAVAHRSFSLSSGPMQYRCESVR